MQMTACDLRDHGVEIWASQVAISASPELSCFLECEAATQLTQINAALRVQQQAHTYEMRSYWRGTLQETRGYWLGTLKETRNY